MSQPSIINLKCIRNISYDLERKLDPILTFVEDNYFSEEFRQKEYNRIDVDNYGSPIWAVLYVLLRAGMIREMLFLIDNYQGNFDVKVFGSVFKNFLTAEAKMEELDSESRNMATMQISTGTHISF